MQTLFTGRELVELEEVDSTNNYALNLSHQQPVKEGMVVWAREQTSGKGQRGNTWISQPGANLTFSIVYLPAFLLAEQQFLLVSPCYLFDGFRNKCVDILIRKRIGA